MENRKVILRPLFWSVIVFLVSQVITFLVAIQYKIYLEEIQITLPKVSLGLPVIYFFGAVVVLGLILFLVSASKLRMLLKIMFALLFGWGTFMALSFSVPLLAACLIAISVALLWLFRPRVWLHNLLMIFALVSVGSVFGFLLSPWTALSFMLIISVYDILAVRFGYMMWMARRLSESDTLPAFIIPKGGAAWNLDIRKVKILEDVSTEREFSILGGGDIGFPLLLMISVFLARGFAASLIVAVFSILGLTIAYLIQLFFLKGKPMPALPPITLASLVGFMLAYYVVT